MAPGRAFLLGSGGGIGGDRPALGSLLRVLDLLLLGGDPGLSGWPFVEESPTNLGEGRTLLLPTPPRERQRLDVQLFRALILVHVVVEDTGCGSFAHIKCLSPAFTDATRANTRCDCRRGAGTGCSFFPLYYQVQKFLCRFDEAGTW
jgi:hypothetical protein